MHFLRMLKQQPPSQVGFLHLFRRGYSQKEVIRQRGFSKTDFYQMTFSFSCYSSFCLFLFSLNAFVSLCLTCMNHFVCVACLYAFACPFFLFLLLLLFTSILCITLILDFVLFKTSPVSLHRVPGFVLILDIVSGAMLSPTFRI